MGQHGSVLLGELEVSIRNIGNISPSHYPIRQTQTVCYSTFLLPFQLLNQTLQQTVSAAEIQRLKKRFMKLDTNRSGSIDKEEFLSIPAIQSNPLASRMIAIFDEE
jgi:hypothetical protein